MTFRMTAAVLLLAAASGLLADGRSQEYEQRSLQMETGLGEQHYALGLWCKQEKLSSEAREHFEYALRCRPGHGLARKELAELDGIDVPARSAGCEIVLRNGTGMKVELLIGTLCVQTGSGVLFIPVENVDLIRLGTDRELDSIAADGFVGKAQVDHETFPVRGKIGLADISRADLAAIRFLRPCPECQGRGTWKCIRCDGKGTAVEKKDCPTCGGKGLAKCLTCKGLGTLRCPDCNGQGFTWGTFGGHRARFQCPHCGKTGRVDCPDCEGGAVPCPDCQSNPAGAAQQVCPECKGRKTVRCAACGGTGVKSPPAMNEKEERKPQEIPTHR